jgi:tyrosine-protein kinase Etk/Wzc
MPQYEITLRDYWRILWKRRWIILLVFLAVVGAAFTYTELLSPVYQASASVKITERKTLALMMTEIFTYAPGDPMKTQARIVCSWPVMEKVVQKLNLAEPGTPTELLSPAIREIQGNITAEVIEGTDIIRIKAVHSDAVRAMQLAETTAHAYVEVNLEDKKREAENLKKYLKQRVEEIKKALDEVDAKLSSFKEQNPEATGAAIPIYNKLESLKREQTELLRKYTERHPDVQRLNAEITSLSRELGRYSRQEIELSQLERDRAINATLYSELKQKLTSTEIEAVQVPDVTVVDHATVPTSPIRPNKMLNRIAGLLIGIILSLIIGFMIDHLDTSIGTIEEIENLLQLPVLGVIPYLKGLVAHLPDSGFNLRRWFIRVFAGSKTEAAIAHSEALRSQLVLNYSPTSPIAEAYRILRTNVLKEDSVKGDTAARAIKTQHGRIILCTSTGPEEGKSISSVNLAITMAQKGATVLLVDLDLRKSIIHKVFGIEKEPGLSNLLTGASKTDEAIRTIADTLVGCSATPGLDWDMVLATPGIDNLHILPSGSAVTNPAEILGSGEMNRVWAELKTKYDYLICDCPPILAVTDVLLIGPKPDTETVLIYRAGRTAKGALFRAKEHLLAANIKIKGVVLNHMSPEIDVSPDYYYHYYRYYPREKKE